MQVGKAFIHVRMVTGDSIVCIFICISNAVVVLMICNVESKELNKYFLIYSVVEVGNKMNNINEEKNKKDS